MAKLSTAFLLLALWINLGGSSATQFKRPAKASPLQQDLEGFYFQPENIYAASDTEFAKTLNASIKREELKTKELSENSLDDKCKLGLPISATWQFYGPYARLPVSNTRSGVEGIFPHLINDMLHECCNANTTVSHGKVLESIRGLEGQLDNPDAAYDLTFPITGMAFDDKLFKDLPFLPFLQAPRVALLVRDDTKIEQTSRLLTTVSRAWPILVFIIIAATLSGIIIWLLDRLKNPDEFPRSFLSGTWEGFWWAFVTMTTVGYGDRAPKSLLARIFCILWILVGIIIIAIFTAIITASLSASIQHHFTVHGSLVGAINGSEEFRLGVSLNAEMKPFRAVTSINDALMNASLNGSLIDNYVLTHYNKYVRENPVRIETTYDHPITYGLVLRNNATNMDKCFRTYLRNHPQEVFEVIAKYLKPLKNPTDDVSQEVKASESLFFYREPAFKRVLHILIGALGFLIFSGAMWELCYHRPKARRQLEESRQKSGSYLALGQMQGKCDCHEMLLNHQTIQAIKNRSTCIKELIKEYEEFYDKWLNKVKEVEREGNGNATPHMV